MKRAYKMRAYPTRQQAARANRLLGIHCELYNAALQERRDAWRMHKISVSYGTQSAQLPYIRANRLDIAEFSAAAQQQTLRRLDCSFAAFFRRIKAGDAPGYPRFRSYVRFNTVDHQNGNGAKWYPSCGRWAKAYFLGVGHLKVSEHTEVVGRVTQISLVRDGRKWFIVVIAESEPIPLPPSGRSIGVDVGIARFATTSDGKIIDNPKFHKAVASELADLQRRYAASGRRSKTLRRKLRKLHRKVKNQRLDFHHKVTRSLVNDNDIIAVERLNIKAMSKREPGKTNLNRSIADVGWGQFIAILGAKAESAGRQVIAVNPAYTSIDCHKCGSRCTRPTQAVVICPQCGNFDADLNGAINILIRAGIGSGLMSQMT